ncbi:hypothetical protein BGZ63DRAFT_387724 [Mariannaea sp. PMI_226]|nr:hypothetical protein BGZ63DRAFT_387724 [Mariannaea sp. PMI_226]
MPALRGFSDNAFQTRSDLFCAARSLIRPLLACRSPSGARVKAQPPSYAAFDDVAAQLEGFCRPLWAIHAIITGESDLQSWLQGLSAGVDPDSTDYWGNVGDFDQRMVEMEAIAFALLSCPGPIMSALNDKDKGNLITWLLQINDHDMPRNNWRWFRIFVNLALTKTLGLPHDDVKHHMDQDFAMLDQFYISDGWSSDGLWGDERKQADYYSGSFAIQFAQLLYVKFADNDEDRVEKYRDQAKKSALTYWRYFSTNGAAIPFGRSLTYRFAFAAFWASLALAEIQLPAPMNDMGIIKGMLLRHLRWWTKHSDMFNQNGTLTIGFAYPNMYLSEAYNSSQSVYWCLKSFVILGLPENHVFWNCDELPHPMVAVNAENSSIEKRPEVIQLNWPARHILCNAQEHHFLLSSGQMTTNYFKAREAKYGKFAYSSAFAFSVPTGLALHQIAPDSTLSISIDGGETWKVRWKPSNVRVEYVPVALGGGDEEQVPALVSVWKPFNYHALELETSLIPAMKQYPGWHIRIHDIRGLNSLIGTGCEYADLVDASFAVPALTEQGYHINKLSSPPADNTTYGWWQDQSSILVKSQHGASGIVNLSPDISVPGSDRCEMVKQGVTSHGHLIEAEPNTNLISPKTFIPSIQSQLSCSPDNQQSVMLVSAVFAVSEESGQRQDVIKMWSQRPEVKITRNASGSNDIRII